MTKLGEFQQKIDEIKEWVKDNFENSREQALVITKLDESQLWGTRLMGKQET